MSKKPKSTTAELLQSLEAIIFEIGRMEDAVRDSSCEDVGDADRRQLRQEIAALRDRADRLMTWLSEARLETPKN